MMMRLFLGFHLLVPVLWLTGCDSNARPNILLITLDTTRADRLGCYGYPKPTSPHIDELAGEGIRFDFAIAQASVTPVSHASILTGLYPFQHGLRVIHGASSFRLKEGAHPTVATLLKEQGWKTAAFVSAFPVSEYFGLHFGFDTFDNGIQGNVEDKMKITETGQAVYALEKNQRRADETTDKALRWLEKNEGQDSFFMWVHYFDPHDQRIKPPRDFCAPFLKDSEPGDSEKRSIYDAEVAFMDQQIGRIFDCLKAEDRFDDTLILITNDHGQGLGDHDWWNHRILYQEQIHMPLVMRLPGGPAGRVIPDLVRSIDIMPTLLEFAGVPVPRVEGKSLLGLIRGEPEPERIAYADALIRLDDNRPTREEFTEEGKYNDLMYCVMTRSWKLIHRYFHPEASELYRIDQDLQERENVIDQYPEKRDELFQFLERPGVMIEKLIPASEENEATQRLRELGYN
ncbi:MAG: sulfatase [Planctomycetota bacterium]